ncbi:hypothetical protein C8R46DRAFT_1086320, partial [Mycena filopes]
MMNMLPATNTKGLPVLRCPFPSASTVFELHQSDDGSSNGTALWLGAQCLSAYLVHSAIVKQGMRAIDLGSGIGLTALTLAHLGCNTIATDLPTVISSCLAKNVENNRPNGPGEIRVRELDWTVPPDRWVWDDDTLIASPACSTLATDHGTAQQSPYFDIIVSADTIYAPSSTPFLRTLHALCASSAPRRPVVLICIERRDPAVIDRFIEEAQSIWGFVVTRVPPRKLSKALEKSGFKWAKDDWDGVELYKLMYRGAEVNSSS